eukprot:1850497-Pleurochrysis_carterae.AAC.3
MVGVVWCSGGVEVDMVMLRLKLLLATSEPDLSEARECADCVAVAAGEPALARALLKAAGVLVMEDGTLSLSAGRTLPHTR